MLKYEICSASEVNVAKYAATLIKENVYFLLIKYLKKGKTFET